MASTVVHDLVKKEQIEIEKKISSLDNEEDLTGKITREILEEIAGYELPYALGFYILGKIIFEKGCYAKNKNGEHTKILLPESIAKMAQYESNVVQVLDIGDIAYRRESLGFKPWIKVGDFILINRYKAITNFLYNSNPMLVFVDDDALIRVPDPEKVKYY